MSKIKYALAAMLTIIFCSQVGAQGLPSKYHTYAEGILELQTLVTENPGICSLDSVGYSNHDSVTIYQFKISDDVSIEEDEPAILFTGGVHADEVLGPEVVLNFCNDIVARYVAGESLAVRYVNNYEIFVIPFVNPEGHIVVENGDMDWRKNKSDNNNNGQFDSHDGVDNNRNFDFGWNIDQTPNGLTPESLEYKGPYAFSESENRSVAAWGIKYKPIIAVEYHSPTYGRSEKVYYCWYWYSTDGGHGMAPDEVSMLNIGRGFAGSIMNDRGDSTYEARRALVNKGDFKTYFYGNFGTAAMVCEVSDTTIQDTLLIEPVCQHNLNGIYWLLRRAGYARLTGVVTDSITGLPLDAIVTVQQATSVDINPRHTRPNTGRYDRLIDPGSYTLVFQKTGYASKTISAVVVNNNGPTTTNARLRPLNPPPAQPVLVSPPDNSVFSDSTSLTFDWGDVANATNYVIEIATDSNFASVLQQDSTVIYSFFRNSVPLYPDTFYWRVTSHNGNGYSQRSSVSQFVIGSGLPPEVPVLLQPYNGYVSSSGYLAFDWTDSPGTNRYMIQVDSDSLFATPQISDSSLSSSQYQNSDSLADGRYYWRVRAGNDFGWSAYSGIFSFDVLADTGLQYIVGDVNHSGTVNGIDVIYFVNYLRGGPVPPLEVNGFYPEADANGNCIVNGIDVVFLVNFFKGGMAPIDGHCFRSMVTGSNGSSPGSAGSELK